MINVERFTDVPENEEGCISAMLVEMVEKIDKKNDPYVVATFVRKASRSEMKIWRTTSAMVAKDFAVGDVVKVHFQTEMYNGELQQKYLSMEKDYTTLVSDVIPAAPYNTEDMYEYILKTVKGTKSGSAPGAATLADLVEAIYAENKDKLLTWPAALFYHHAIRGGLLMHCYRMVRLADSMSRIYPSCTYGTDTPADVKIGSQPIDREVLICAAAVHDIGKLREMQPNIVGSGEYTKEGNLLGHSALGIEMLKDAVREHQLDIDHEKLMMLYHCIAAHHGKLEFGAIKEPQTMEATLLNLIDTIDAKVYEYSEAYTEVKPGEQADSKRLGGKVYHPEYIPLT